MEETNHVLELTGQTNLWVFFYLVLYALIGVVAVSGTSLKTRDKESDRTPYHFSLRVYIKDNFRKWVVSLVLIYLALRFTPEILGIKISNWVAVLIGLGSDGLATLLKNYSTILNMKTGAGKIENTTPAEPKN